MNVNSSCGVWNWHHACRSHGGDEDSSTAWMNSFSCSEYADADFERLDLFSTITGAVVVFDPGFFSIFKGNMVN